MSEPSGSDSFLRPEPVPVEPVEQIPAADWVDQDLLTREDSAELLRQEIEAETARLAALDAADLSPDEREASRAMLRRRIEAMESVRSNLLG